MFTCVLSFLTVTKLEDTVSLFQNGNKISSSSDRKSTGWIDHARDGNHPMKTPPVYESGDAYCAPNARLGMRGMVTIAPVRSGWSELGARRAN